MPNFSNSDTLRAVLAGAAGLANVAAVRRDMYAEAARSDEVTWDVVRALSRDTGTATHVLLRGCRVVAPPPFVVRSQQSEAAKATFDQQRRELDAKRYRAMVADVVAPQEEDHFRDRREIKSFRDQLGIGLNIIITRVCLLACGWWIGSRVSPLLGPLLGVVFMVIGFAAEIGIFMIKAERLNETLEQRAEAEKTSFPGSGVPVPDPAKSHLRGAAD